MSEFNSGSESLSFPSTSELEDLLNSGNFDSGEYETLLINQGFDPGLASIFVEELKKAKDEGSI